MRLVSTTRWQRQQAAAHFNSAAACVVALSLAAATVHAATQAAAAGQPATIRGNAERGEELFGKSGCIGCHKINGIGGEVGPDLSRVSKLNLGKDRPGQSWPSLVAYIRESLEQPQKYIVPGFPKPSPMPSARQLELTETDIEDLIAYLFDVAGGTKTR